MFFSVFLLQGDDDDQDVKQQMKKKKNPFELAVPIYESLHSEKSYITQWLAIL